MPLPNSGPMSLNMIAGEFGGSVPHSISEYYGKDAGIPNSGTISFSQFYGKSNMFVLNVTTSVASPDLHAMAVAAGWNQNVPLVVNFNCPYVNSLRLDGSKTFPRGITLNISTGCLVGGIRNAGTAIYTRVPVAINNNGIITGGGGAGGYGADAYVYYRGNTLVVASGGDGGDGQGFTTTSSLTIATRGTGSTGDTETYSGAIIVGDERPWCKGGDGGDGGLWGQSGGTGGSNTRTGGDYSSGGLYRYPAAGRAAGGYVDGNAYVTWVKTGDVRGTLS